MKILANTEDGGRVVELSKDEFRELRILAQSFNPSVEDWQGAMWQLKHAHDDTVVEEINNFDFTDVFASVRAFYEMKFNINKIRNLVDAIEKSLKEK